MTAALRLILAALTTVGLLLSVATWGIRQHAPIELPRSIRWRGLALVPVMAGIDFGVLYAFTNHLPLNKGLWLTVPAMAVFDVVWGYFFVRDSRDTISQGQTI